MRAAGSVILTAKGGQPVVALPVDRPDRSVAPEPTRVSISDLVEAQCQQLRSCVQATPAKHPSAAEPTTTFTDWTMRLANYLGGPKAGA
jgi:flavoprotein